MVIVGLDSTPADELGVTSTTAGTYGAVISSFSIGAFKVAR